MIRERCLEQSKRLKLPLRFILSISNVGGKVNNTITGLDRPWGFQEVETPRFQDNRHMKVVSLSTLHTGHLHAPRNITGTHLCWRLSIPQGHSAVRRIMSMKNSNDTIGNRTRVLPARNTVCQQTAPPRATSNVGKLRPNTGKNCIVLRRHTTKKTI